VAAEIVTAAALTSLRALSRGFAVPDDACTTYRALYEDLARFEHEQHEHVHLENNVLFPRVVNLDARGGASSADGAGPLTVAGRWEDAGVVRGFSTAAPNEVLLAFVRAELARRPGLRVLDVGCGAARNAAPMAAEGATVIGTDVAWPMLEAARRRVDAEGVGRRAVLVRAPMDELPLGDASVDLVVAHGVWNLARSAAELRRAIAEAARVTRPGAGLFVFTFSRATLAPDDQPVPGEPFAFTQFAGEPQCFLTETDLPWILAIRKNDAVQSNWPVTALTDGRASARRSRRSK
jgi:ubiquinone/menaquinone biosynthesis C-methylase UbiE